MVLTVTSALYALLLRRLTLGVAGVAAAAALVAVPFLGGRFLPEFKERTLIAHVHALCRDVARRKPAPGRRGSTRRYGPKPVRSLPPAGNAPSFGKATLRGLRQRDMPVPQRLHMKLTFVEGLPFASCDDPPFRIPLTPQGSAAVAERHEAGAST